MTYTKILGLSLIYNIRGTILYEESKYIGTAYKTAD